MEYKDYKNRKQDFDGLLIQYFAKRIFDDVGEADACVEDITDSVGNIVNPNSKSDKKWAFTEFDKIILAMKNSLGEKYLRNLLKNYSWIKDIDPLFIMNMKKGTDLQNVRKNLGMIVTTMEDSSYLPDGLEHNKEHVEYEDEDINFCDKVSKALTIATLLLYTLRNDKIPTSIDFKHNILPSVEITFTVRPYDDYEECIEYCNTHKLIESYQLSQTGMKKLVSIAKYMVSGKLFFNNFKRVENQSKNWKNLAKLAK